MLLILSVSCKKNNLQVTTTPISSIDVTSAYTGGNVSHDGGSEVIVRGVCFAIFSSPSLSNASFTQDGSGLGEYTSKLSGLKPNTTYHVRAYAKNAKGIAYGDEKTFTTNSYYSATTPIVQTDSLSNTDTLGLKLTLNGEILYPGGSAVTETGFVYSSKKGASISDTKIISNGTISPFSGLFNFQIGEIYYVNSYAINSFGVAYGQEIQVQINRAKPKISTSQITEIDSTSAISGGEVLTDGGIPILAKGVCWTTHATPTINDNATVDGTGLGKFTSKMTGLLPNTTYYCRSYATTSEGTTYGSEFTFKTVVSKLYLGMLYKGGILFYLNPTGAGGMIVISEDLSTSYSWGCSGVNISGAMNSGIGSGLTNSDAIISACSSDNAAKLCEDLVYGTYDDWFLPSMDELAVLYKNLKTTDLAKFSTGYYWSSNQKDASTAYRYGFLGGNSGTADKSSLQYVRAIRKFN